MVERARKPENRAEYEAQLDCPPLPSALAHLWGAFERLSRRRSSSGFGDNPISWPDIDAFLRHSRLRLSPFEIEMIELLDDLYRSKRAELSSGKPPKGPKEK